MLEENYSKTHHNQLTTIGKKKALEVARENVHYMYKRQRKR